jgi:hypothetical protein
MLTGSRKAELVDDGHDKRSRQTVTANRDGEGHLVYAVSDDGAKTFHANRLVSAPSFPFDTFQYSTGWLGDYYEPALAGGQIYALWSDGREDDQSHAFFAKASVR